MEPLLGQIIMFAGTFAPRGWAFCDGSTLPIENNPALYSILGTTYGGDGRRTFALPDLRGRAPVHEGSGRRLGSQGNLTGNLTMHEPGKGTSTEAAPYLAVNYIIAVQGMFPPRN
ncbi:tail fiber protein [Leptolyngbya cf. ectocarpi LEGE 11479]|uniref:Tail fiber protein n=1 Tax=Leptolyngbya cf. ectocarpi LEGE 11479 TaxID=1828722 RepID=A0A929FCW5_LEPEC|nr:tail fiber protein [Leptolyngbya ectocarpi]MBE9070492.1 tail fiber protein [Leptolyngbya cf. ectocarpi LEGE 11479]